MTTKMYRQGDVLLVEVDAPPNGLKEKDNVLARGEATGHSHRIEGAKVYVTKDGMQVVQVERAARLVHEEHGEIAVGPGLYKVVVQREYTPQRARQVRD
jgi:hypothetical protein